MNENLCRDRFLCEMYWISILLLISNGGNFFTIENQILVMLLGWTNLTCFLFLNTKICRPLKFCLFIDKIGQ